jgi:hypothetical protein
MPGIYMVTLNKGVEAKAFAKFMVEEVFPGIAARGQTRIGKVNFLQLLRGSNTSLGSGSGNQDEFLWLVDGNVGGIVGGGGFVEKVEQYGARVKHLGDFSEAGVWRSEAP